MSTAVFAASQSRPRPSFVLVASLLASPLLLGALVQRSARLEDGALLPDPGSLFFPSSDRAADEADGPADAPRPTLDAPVAPSLAPLVPVVDVPLAPAPPATPLPTRLSSRELALFLDILDPAALPAEARRTVARALTLAADGAGVDPLLLLAVIRVESEFRTTVRSPRGALGLMQVRPGTAAPILASLGALSNDEALADPAAIERVLVDPEVNIVVGAEYLVTLLRRYDGDLTRALAAYNAGPRRLRERSAETGESVPEAYAGYARRVQRTWKRYRNVLETHRVAMLGSP